MKKILLLLFLSVGFYINNAQAQTKEQTIEWLNAKAGNIHNPEFAKMYYLKATSNDVELFYPQYNGYSDVRHINFSKMTAANYVLQEGAYKLRIMGKIDRVFNPDRSSYFGDISKYNEYGVTMDSGVYSVIEIWYSVTEDEIKQLKKGYEHLAKLCGASVANNDLFKN
ncbi:hypothetical protein [Runella limosa]|uniref:hypothetical protein n=1 Tax=Runella limosa TaxID=370978 RepID=UPI0012FBCB97|nr:hypothetical protein [Runella limosa]